MHMLNFFKQFSPSTDAPTTAVNKSRLVQTAATAIIFVVIGAFGMRLVLSVLESEPPPVVASGHTLAWQIAQTIGQSDQVLQSSGTYTPNAGMFLYTHLASDSSNQVRIWAEQQLGTFANQFANFGEAEPFTWLIDYGNPTIGQELIQSPLARAADPTSHTYLSLQIPGEPLNATDTAATAVPEAEVPESVEPVEETAVSTLSLDFDGTPGDWLPLTGSWELADGIYAQRDPSGFDMITMLNQALPDVYQLQTDFRIIDGTMGGGLIFNAPAADSRNGAQILDFDNNGGFIRWARYAEDGGYIYEGGTAVEPSVMDGNWHTLQVQLNEAEVIYRLDGQEFGRSPRVGNGRYAGLVTSLTNAEFDNFLITDGTETAVPASPPQTEPTVIVVTEPTTPVEEAAGITEPVRVFSGHFDNGAISWQPISGNWFTEDGTYIQDDNTGFDLITMLNVEPLTHFSFETRLLSRDGNLGGGIIYNAPDLASRANAQIIDFIDQGSYLRWGHYNQGGDFVFDGGTPVDPPINDGQWHILRAVTHGEETLVYLNNQEMGRIQNQSASGYLGLTTSQAQIAFDDVTVLQLPAGNINVSTEPFNDDFSSGSLENWVTFGGNWEIVEGELQQLVTDAFDMGAISPFSHNSYDLEARFRYADGDMGAGFFFNATNRDNKLGSQMVNFTQQGNALQWGHFGENGDFVFEGITNVQNVADGNWHTLHLTVANGRASIILDEELLVQDIELTYTSGYVGLMVSQSHVLFDDVQMIPNTESSLALGDILDLDKTYTFDDGSVADWLPITGDWQLGEGTYEQLQQNEYDRFSTLNVQMVGPYRFATQLKYVEGEMGGGLIFNMQQRNSKAQSQMVSFTANGTFLQWGSFDIGGIFSYQGGTPISNMQDGDWHELAVEVGESSFNILLDGTAVATDIPLTYTTGFVGLFDGLSWVAYDNVALTGPARTLLVAQEESTETPAEEGAPVEEGTPTEEGAPAEESAPENTEPETNTEVDS